MAKEAILVVKVFLVPPVYKAQLAPEVKQGQLAPLAYLAAKV